MRIHCCSGAFPGEECSGADVQEILVSLCRLPRYEDSESEPSEKERPDNTENHLQELFMLPGFSPAIQCWMR